MGAGACNLKNNGQVGLIEKVKLNQGVEGREGIAIQISAEGPVVGVSLVRSR